MKSKPKIISEKILYKSNLSEVIVEDNKLTTSSTITALVLAKDLL